MATAQKTTLPFEEQFPGWFAAAALFPELFDAFRQLKPQMFGQIFGKGFDEKTLAPYRRFATQYQPFDYLASNPFGRPGGPSAAETDVLNSSLFGTTAPFDPLGTTGTAAQNFANFNQGLFPGMGGGGGGVGPIGTRPPGGGAAGGGGGFANIMSGLFGGLGGRLPLPSVPSAPQIPGAPSLPPFSFDTARYAQNAYNALIQGQPGLAAALQAALHPQIALPEQNIFQQVAAQSGQGGPLDKYVQAATQGSTKAFENELAKQQLALNSRFAGEGVFGSGANLSALSNLTSDATARFGETIGNLQLSAANQERERIFKAAETQYGTEYARNLAQVQLQAEDALKMQQTFESLAASTGSSQAAAQAAAYGDQAKFLADNYRTQVNALESAYGTQASIYGSQLGAYSTQQGQVLSAAQHAAELMSKNYGMSFDQAFKIALANQSNRQSALDSLRQNYYQPGQNLLAALQPFFGLPSVSKTIGGGISAGGLLGTLGSIGSLIGGGGGGGGTAAANAALDEALAAAL